MPNLILRSCTAAATCCLLGCQVSVDQPSDDYYGEAPARAGAVSVAGSEAELSVEWTIEGSTDPGACYDYYVDHAYVTIEDDAGIVDEADVDCEAFGYDAPPLPPGIYWATIVLRDSSGHDVTEIADSDDRDLAPGTSDYVSFDFGRSSFR